MQLSYLKVTRLYSEQNDSYFEDLPALEGHARFDYDLLTAATQAHAFKIHEYKKGFYEDWHTPDLGNFIVIFLCGKQQIETSKGEKRMFTSGDMLYVQDTTGKGHRTYGVEDGTSIIIEVCA